MTRPKREVVVGRPATSSALWATCGIALVSLPGDTFSWIWVAAWILPRGPRRLPSWGRFNSSTDSTSVWRPFASVCF